MSVDEAGHQRHAARVDLPRVLLAPAVPAPIDAMRPLLTTTRAGLDDRAVAHQDAGVGNDEILGGQIRRVREYYQDTPGRQGQRAFSWREDTPVGSEGGRLRDARASSAFLQIASDQIFGKLTFSIDTGCRSAWARKPGRSRSDLKPMCTVNGEIARSTPRENRVRAAEVIQDDDLAARLADTPHLS